VKHTKYEKARIIGARSLQLAAGAPVLIKLSKAELESINFSTVKIAELEYEKKVLPISIKRQLA
jgi:DNA-directed RNA polymerase subunit K